MCMCIHIYIYIYIHTHTHTYIADSASLRAEVEGVQAPTITKFIDENMPPLDSED